jgi:hypothetical protein
VGLDEVDGFVEAVARCGRILKGEEPIPDLEDDTSG